MLLVGVACAQITEGVDDRWSSSYDTTLNRIDTLKQAKGQAAINKPNDLAKNYENMKRFFGDSPSKWEKQLLVYEYLVWSLAYDRITGLPEDHPTVDSMLDQLMRLKN